MENKETLTLTENEKSLVNSLFEEYEHAMRGLEVLTASISKRREFIWTVIRQMYPEQMVKGDNYNYNKETGEVTVISKDEFDWEEIKKKYKDSKS